MVLVFKKGNIKKWIFERKIIVFVLDKLIFIIFCIVLVDEVFLSYFYGCVKKLICIRFNLIRIFLKILFY